VADAVDSGCSTQQVEGLSKQIIAQAACIAADAYVEVPKRPNASYGNAVLPFMQQPGQKALLAALDENSALNMTINSMLRTVAQQYLLYRWYQLGKCNIALAAKPGSSNHETGLAIDISEASTWRPILEAKGFAWFGSNDPVHFDWAGPDTKDYKGVDVRAFQQLWNINNPSDLIAEDGLYGPQTEARLLQSSATGFATGPEDCGPSDPEPPVTGGANLSIQLNLDASDTLSDGPSQGVVDLYVGDKRTLRVELTNTGDASSDKQSAKLELPDSLRSDSTTTLDIEALPPAGTQSIELDVEAIAYSLFSQTPATLGLSLGDNSAELPVDVYSQRQFEFESGRREGFNCKTVTGSCAGEGIASDLSLTSPPLDIEVAPNDKLVLSFARLAAGAGSAELLLQDGDAEVAFLLELDGDDRFHEFVLAAEELPARIRGLRLRAVPRAEAGSWGGSPLRIELDYLRIGPDDRFVAGDNSGCSCSLPRSGQQPTHFLLLAFVLCGLCFRRRARAKAACHQSG
jgi:hypothetical protein